MDMMRIPLATALFVGSVGLLYYLWKPGDAPILDTTTSGIIAVACIVVLVYSFMLYSNINIVK